jgi:hypothetical protein
LSCGNEGGKFIGGDAFEKNWRTTAHSDMPLTLTLAKAGEILCNVEIYCAGWSRVGSLCVTRKQCWSGGGT